MKKPNQDFYKTLYADLLDKSTDPALERLIRDLDNLYTATPEPPKQLTSFSSTNLFRQRWQREQSGTPTLFAPSRSGKFSAPRLVLVGMGATVLIVIGILIGVVLSLGTGRETISGAVATGPTSGPTIPVATPTSLLGAETRGNGDVTAPITVSPPFQTAIACPDSQFTIGGTTLNKCLLDYARDMGLAKDLNLSKTGLAKELSLSRTTNGVTITLNRVYADANHILVSYTMSGLWGIQGELVTKEVLKVTNPQDTTGNRQDIELPRIDFWHNGQVSGVVNPTDEIVLRFDTSKITLNPKDLKLHLEISNIRIAPPSVINATFSSTPTGSSSGMDTKGTLSPTSVPQISLPTVILAQPLAFDFDVPFQPSQILNLNQTVSNGTTKMRLDKVGITPLGARFYMKRIIANQKGYESAFADHKFLSANFSVGQPTIRNVSIFTQASSTSTKYSPEQLATLKELEGTIEFEITSFGLDSRQGEWVLSIVQSDASSFNVGPAPTPGRNDIFTFRFTVP